MADNLSQPFSKSAMTEEEKVQFQREKKQQVVAFVLMIFLTLLAFLAVAADFLPVMFVIPFILLLALVQFVLQMFYFMHLKDNDHGWANAFIWSGVFIAIPTIAALMLLLGITKY
ncbi:cytochrome C oxidase subunit IV family protein [Desertibacillus haloalkaliphilus]|uniref:cytochrome C oxidase subunit IV family protein n=1 Tax=Desertibacillus haloalkaliphilus TaxID=1328930 RepID=UPI001C262C91|nr:cytochrome C oxidase subunit IV family protein [Desertibacillus haloalkaliphilus]MBU8907152.1 cytochrome C oxidase subunit IV family protein [Desertibacillus haloalkaliphilus]